MNSILTLISHGLSALANYKINQNSITVGSVTTQLPFDAKIMPLYDNTFGSSAADTFENLTASAVYIVPTGKKYKILGAVTSNKEPNGGICVLWSGTSVDALTTSLNAEIPIPRNTIKDTVHEFSLINSDTVPAGRYVTMKPTTISFASVYLIGYEVNAT